MTDYLKKYKSLFSTTLASGIGTGTGDTLTLSSVTGLPTDTPITITVDRVDSEGNTTPTKLERITGTISGSNLTSYTRGVDGTTEQAHSAGAVIEMIFNAEDWNDVVDWGLVEHDQDGTHKSTLVTTFKATGAEINTGTEDEKIVTPKALADSNFKQAIDEDNMASDSATKVPTQQSVKAYVDSGTVTMTNKTLTAPVINNGTFTGGGALSSKVISITRDMTAASGDVSYTGVGFTPTAMIGFGDIEGADSISIGAVASDKSDENLYFISAFAARDDNGAFIRLTVAGGAHQRAVVKTYDSDGFTLTWTKSGSPTGTAKVGILCLR